MGETGGFGGAGEQAAPSPEPARLLTTANNDRDLDGHDHYYAPQERPVRIHRFSSVLYQSDSETRLMRRVLQCYNGMLNTTSSCQDGAVGTACFSHKEKRQDSSFLKESFIRITTKTRSHEEGFLRRFVSSW
jgi:hypothetical protein